MNQIGPHSDVHQSHMATAYQTPATGPPAPLGHYNTYQPTLLQPGPQTYSSAPAPYQQHQYASQPTYPVSSSMSNALVPSPMPLPAISSAPSGALAGSQYNSGHTFDTTGQIAPPGMKPRVTATLWEDEGSLCFQVEAKGVCVARREDNHMINGTKLLNVAGMTRGRRDGILKSEKTRHVVKIGPMHLKGVWIPFDRALDFANKEKITEQLYPLFVHDIGALLYHPSNQPRPGLGNSSALAAVDRRRSDARLLGAPPVTSAPPLHHHHSISTPMSQPHSIAPHPASGRPGLDRAHTFPTPPTSASSNFGGVAQHNSYASTPPGIQQYQTSQPYDSSRQMYTAPSTQYPSQMRQFGGPLPSTTIKSDMAPPPRAGEVEHSTDAKPQDGHDDHGDHDSAYTHAQASYGPTRSTYSYNPNAPPVARVEEVSSSPHQNGSGRETPRTASDAQWQSGYSGQPSQPPAGNVYNPIESRANGDGYVGFPSAYVNGGSIPSSKRIREVDDDEEEALKRQKTAHQDGGPVGGSSPFRGAPTQKVRGR
ncbi:hypothetical protein, variant 3 [Verruconis gallopava]|uniref:HTH APSES-type domain-containing protein n=1 Tax=Verruconis gallopava TaxID=253628 RepID=A0A0D2A952_9PEZI|nr:hypothetical protein, variant 3 [Verruconis gallopava]KIW03070.1 hypothetical protein, variant 3 [Verruconis gallopava]